MVAARRGAWVDRMKSIVASLLLFVVTTAANADIWLPGDRSFGLSPGSGDAPAAGSNPSAPPKGATTLSLSGNGRFGLVYQDAEPSAEDARLSYRLRLDLDASRQTDGGVTFGARVRTQSGSTDAANAPGLNAGTLYATWP